MLAVKHLAPEIIMAVNYCGRHLARRLGWAEPACHRKEGTILERAGLACGMTGGLKGALVCGSGRGI